MRSWDIILNKGMAPLLEVTLDIAPCHGVQLPKATPVPSQDLCVGDVQ
jgi:hypothetical protein